MARSARKPPPSRSSQNTTEPSVALYLRRWLIKHRRRWKPATYEMYNTLIGVHILPTFANRKPSSLTLDDVRMWQKQLAKHNIGINAQKRVQQVMAQALQPFVYEAKLSRNVFRAVPIPEVPRPDVVVPTTAQVRKLLNYANSRQTEAMILLASTAMLRIGEVLSLRMRDVNLKARQVVVSAMVSRKLLKGQSVPESRVLQLPNITVRALQRHLRYRGDIKPDQPLFAGAGGKRLDRHNFRNRVWVPLLKAARLPEEMHFDCLRYASRALLLKAGVTPEVVAKRARLRNARVVYERHGALALEHEAGALKRPRQKAMKSKGAKRR